jgi:ATP-binding cassette subfamily B protein/subfamily B ATP-binding cassette protein MsbA
MSKPTAVHPTLSDIWTLTWQRLGPRKLTYAAGLVLSLSQSLVMMLDPLIVNLVFNAFEAGEFADVRLIVAAGTAVFFFLTGTMLVGEYLKQDALNELNAGLMAQAADVAQRLPLEYAQSTHSSDLVQRAAQDTRRLTDILNLMLDRMSDQIAMFAMAAVYLLVLNWRIALPLLAVSPLILAAGHLIRKRLKTIGGEIAEQEAVVRQCLQDALQNMEIVRALGAEEWMTERFEREKTRLNRLYSRRVWWQQAVMLTTTSLSNLIILVTILIVGWLAIRGEMALGSLMVYFTLVWRINSPLESIGQLWGQVQEHIGASGRVFRLLEAEKEPIAAAGDPKAQTVPRSDPQGGLTMSRVSFRYRRFAEPLLPAETPDGEAGRAVRAIDLELAPGTFTALVGPSGSGKSTAAKLAAGLLFPHAGQIRICGLDPRADADAARALVAYVPQTPYLFGGTIRDNIAVARYDASDEEVIEAARAAMAHAFIEQLPDGYGAVIREHGQTLSGGQKQRIALACAVLSGRPIWILDEATSALDAETEREIVGMLHRFKEQGHAILFIAHRLSAVTGADEIVVMQDGAVVQRGRHEELLRDRQGLYRQLWESFEPLASAPL